MKYISIDGDDIGQKITSYYLSNNSKELKSLSIDLKESTEEIATFLETNKFTVVFCAADGVVAFTEIEQNFDDIFIEINKFSPTAITFSAGVGSDLREAYIALLSAKSNGKGCLHIYANSFEMKKQHV